MVGRSKKQEVLMTQMVEEMTHNNLSGIIECFRLVLQLLEHTDTESLAGGWIESLEVETFSTEGRAVLHYQIQWHLHELKRFLDHRRRIHEARFPDFDWSPEAMMDRDRAEIERRLEESFGDAPSGEGA